jgi:hypothetical protein
MRHHVRARCRILSISVIRRITVLYQIGVEDVEAGTFWNLVGGHAFGGLAVGYEGSCCKCYC